MHTEEINSPAILSVHFAMVGPLQIGIHMYLYTLSVNLDVYMYQKTNLATDNVLL